MIILYNILLPQQKFSEMKRIKENLERLTLSMQFFCLDPKLTIFNEIVNNTKLKNQQADYYNVWHTSAIARYGSIWNFEPTVISKAVQDNKANIEKFTNTQKPTSEMSDKLWYIFFASGKVDDLENVFSLTGARGIDSRLANILSDRFETFKDEYTRKVSNVLREKPDYFTSHECHPFPLEASQAFDKLISNIEKMREDISDAGNVEALISRLNSTLGFGSSGFGSSDFVQSTQAGEDSKESKESKESKKKRLAELLAKYDAIEQKVIKKKK